jgi:hypothetical protein
MKLLNPNKSTENEQMPAGYKRTEGAFKIMQSLQLFILESQSARKRLLQIFELPDDSQSSPETQRIDSGCGEELFLPFSLTELSLLRRAA